MTLPLLGAALQGGARINDLRTRLRMADTDERREILRQERERVVQERAAKMDEARMKLLGIQTQGEQLGLETARAAAERTKALNLAYPAASEAQDLELGRKAERAKAEYSIENMSLEQLKIERDRAKQEFDNRIEESGFRIDELNNTLAGQKWERENLWDLKLQSAKLENAIKQKELDQKNATLGGLGTGVPTGGPLAAPKGMPGPLPEIGNMSRYDYGVLSQTPSEMISEGAGISAGTGAGGNAIPKSQYRVELEAQAAQWENALKTPGISVQEQMSILEKAQGVRREIAQDEYQRSNGVAIARQTISGVKKYFLGLQAQTDLVSNPTAFEEMIAESQDAINILKMVGLEKEATAAERDIGKTIQAIKTASMKPKPLDFSGVGTEQPAGNNGTQPMGSEGYENYYNNTPGMKVK